MRARALSEGSSFEKSNKNSLPEQIWKISQAEGPQREMFEKELTQEKPDDVELCRENFQILLKHNATFAIISNSNPWPLLSALCEDIHRVIDALELTISNSLKEVQFARFLLKLLIGSEFQKKKRKNSNNSEDGFLWNIF